LKVQFEHRFEESALLGRILLLLEIFGLFGEF
jgi:hypothetical protein